MCVRKLNQNLKKACGKLNKLLRWAFEFLYNFWLSTFSLGRETESMGIQSAYTSSNESLQIVRIIPEAKGLPIFGTFFDLIAAGGARQLHNYIDRRHRELGSIFCEHLGGASQVYVFVSSASQMRSVFLFEGQFPKHPLPEAWTLYNELFQCKRGLFFMEDIEWLHNRRILSRFLLNGNLNWMDSHIESATMKLINEWKLRAPSSLSEEFIKVSLLESRLYRWAIDVICHIMFGQTVLDYPEVDKLLDEFSKIVHNVFEKSTALMDFPPKLAKCLNLRIWKNFEQDVTNVLKMGSEVIDKFVELLKDNVISDEFTKAHENVSLFQKLQGSQMSLALIKRIFLDLVIAAGDTTAYTTVWALALISQNEKMQSQMLDDIIKHGEESPLVAGLIRETLRLYPVAPFIGRFLDTDAVIDNYHIRKNTLVLLSLYTAGRDPKHFPDPLTIIPERWQRSNGEFTQVLQAHGSIPFAIGNRSCVGRKIAMKQMISLLTAVIINFEMKCGNLEPIEPILRLVTVPNQTLRLFIKCR